LGSFILILSKKSYFSATRTVPAAAIAVAAAAVVHIGDTLVAAAAVAAQHTHREHLTSEKRKKIEKKQKP